MNRSFIGIDLGTSSVKVLCRYEDGRTEKTKAAYEEISPAGWWNATVKALSELDTSSAAAVGLSSQVGTYIINEKDVISWSSGAGAEEIREIKASFPAQRFIREISMPHPQILSYPIPRLRFIQKGWGDGARVCQPKDLLGKLLTGRYATDKYSWRGLANMETGRYSDYFLKEAGSPQLPGIIGHTEKLGTVTEEASALTGLPKGLPVYAGLNDFFASLLGMGIRQVGDMFDITGTSEHLGIITGSLAADTSMVSGPYLENFVHYGVTASSGASLSFGMEAFGVPDTLSLEGAPVFTPYLNGERAPIFDRDAVGTFFGIRGDCTREQLACSVLEGVVFSIFHIYESIGKPAAKKLVASGGAAQNDALNYLKAEMFGIPVTVPEESDTSALGAALVAAIGSGAYPDMDSAIAAHCRISKTVEPDGRLQSLLRKRFEIYKALYPSLKDAAKQFKEVQP